MAVEEAWRVARRRRIPAELDEQNNMLTETLGMMTEQSQTMQKIGQRLGSTADKLGGSGKQLSGVDEKISSLQAIMMDGFARQAESQAEIIRKVERIMELKGIK
jgi:archaellum component FlaC